MLVSVCMCTYKRTHLLQTLMSIAELYLRDKVELEVIVVDNDVNESGKAILQDLKQDFPHKLIYLTEPKKNISAARNVYLMAAKGDWIASLDDDEVADRHWLESLLKTAEGFNADIVFGQVLSLLPESTPEWIIQGGFFDRTLRSTGEVVSSGGTGCTLMRAAIIRETNFCFDLSYGQTGGEDADLFYRLHSAGYKLVYCKAAIVSEIVEKNRLNSDYLIRRSFRIGQTYSKYRFNLNKPIFSKLIHFFEALMKINALIFLVVITMPLGKKIYYRYVLRCAENIGKIAFYLTTKKVALYS